MSDYSFTAKNVLDNCGVTPDEQSQIAENLNKALFKTPLTESTVLGMNFFKSSKAVNKATRRSAFLSAFESVSPDKYASFTNTKAYTLLSTGNDVDTIDSAAGEYEFNVDILKDITRTSTTNKVESIKFHKLDYVCGFNGLEDYRLACDIVETTPSGKTEISKNAYVEDLAEKCYHNNSETVLKSYKDFYNEINNACRKLGFDDTHSNNEIGNCVWLDNQVKIESRDAAEREKAYNKRMQTKHIGAYAIDNYDFLHVDLKSKYAVGMNTADLGTDRENYLYLFKIPDGLSYNYYKPVVAHVTNKTTNPEHGLVAIVDAENLSIVSKFDNVKKADVDKSVMLNARRICDALYDSAYRDDYKQHGVLSKLNDIDNDLLKSLDGCQYMDGHQRYTFYYEPNKAVDERYVPEVSPSSDNEPKLDLSLIQESTPQAPDEGLQM